MIRSLSLSLFVAGLTLISEVALASEKYALLIGVAKYDHARMNEPLPLRYPEEDAKALEELFQSGGYETELLLGKSATQAAIQAKLAELTNKGDADGVVLVGLFGHGVEIQSADEDGNSVTDQCYCPFDTNMREILDRNGNRIPGQNKQPQVEPDPATLIKLSEVMARLKNAKAGTHVVLADCCRKLPGGPRGRSFGANFSSQDLPNRTAILFGCSLGEEAFEHEDWGHGAFTKSLLEQIPQMASEGEVTTGTLGDRLKKQVQQLVTAKSAKKSQTPQTFGTDSLDLQLLLDSSLAPGPRNMVGRNAGDVQTFSKGLEIRCRWIPAGPAGSVSAKGYWLGEHEVTQSEWQRITRTTPWQGQKGVAEDARMPASYVPFAMAQEFCRTLTERSHQDGSLAKDWEFRLPTFEEWEIGCRAGTATERFFQATDGTLTDFAWCLVNVPLTQRTAQIVGKKNPNAWGLMDVYGNVAEWCDTGEADAATLRGGGFGDRPEKCQSTSSSPAQKTHVSSSTGFRICVSPTR